MKTNSHARKTPSSIPPPPGIEAGYEALMAYHQKYSVEELQGAGYLEEPPAEETRQLAATAAFQLLCKNGLRLRLKNQDYKRLSCLASRLDVSVENLVADWVRQRLREESKPALAARGSKTPKRARHSRTLQRSSR